MKPNAHVRTMKGYCCERCNGPIANFKKSTKRRDKRRDKRIANKLMQKDLDTPNQS